MRLLVLLCVIVGFAHAFVVQNGAFMKAPSTTRKHMFNPLAGMAKKFAGGNSGGGDAGGGGGEGMDGFMKLMSQAQQMKSKMEKDEIVAQDSTGGIKVTFNGMGAPLRVDISDRMMGLGAVAVGQAITQTLIDAHARSSNAMQTNMLSMMGGITGNEMDM